MSKWRIIIGGLLCLLGLLIVQSLASIVRAQTDAEQEAAQVLLCSADRPLAYVRESVALQAWLPFTKKEKPKFLWHVDAGTIRGEGAQVSWDFSGVSPGTYQAKVSADNDSNCRVTVTVGLPPLVLMNGGYETGRAILLAGHKEDKGYGLYSYLLFGAEPDKSTEQRYLQAVIEYLKFPDVQNLEKNGFRRAELNITYLLLEKKLGQQAVQDLEARQYKKYPEIADWILKHYDYSRALLRSLAGNHRDGPYLISFLQPLGKKPLTPPYLYMDISSVPPDLVKIWMKYFKEQAAQERYWDENTAKRLVFKMRTLLGIAAQGLPDVQNALKDWIAWVKKVS